MHAGRWVVIGVVAAAVGLAWAGFALRRANAPRSVVLITVDTLRADRLGSYGRTPSITPELDALAARGVVFERAWTTAPLTVPAHATLLTGLIPPKHGLRVNRPPARLPAPSDRRFFTLAELLKERGYATGAFVSASVLRDDDTGFGAGFAKYDEVPRAAQGSMFESERPGRAADTVEKALAWVESASGPVFLWVHLFDPHAPYHAPAGWGAGPEHTADATGYDAEVAYTDHCIGVLLKGLAGHGHADAVVAVVSDHGEGLGEHGEPAHGYLLHEATLHVPLIFAAPGLASSRRAEVVSSVDVFPTLLSLAGHPVPPQVNGVPLFAKSADGVAARPVYAETLYPWHSCRWAQAFALRRGDEKLVTAGSTSLAYDLAADPREEHPSAPGPDQRDAIADMLRVAREAALGTATAADPAIISLPYFGSGTSAGTPVLADAENAKLPSPYDRMDVLRRFGDACTLMSTGKADSALTGFDELLAADPGNLQVAFWRGRALEALGRFSDAGAAYRHTFEIGLRSPACVDKALFCALKAMERMDPAGLEAAAEWTTATTFLASSRGRGVPDDAWTYLLEVALHLDPQHRDLAKAREALRRAETAPGADGVRPNIAEARAKVDFGRELALESRRDGPRDSRMTRLVYHAIRPRFTGSDVPLKVMVDGVFRASLASRAPRQRLGMPLVWDGLSARHGHGSRGRLRPTSDRKVGP